MVPHSAMPDDPGDTSGDKGRMIVVVGPSGAGKDSLIAYAKRHFAEQADAERCPVHFVQRVITRAADAGGEDHRPASPSEFDDLKAAGGFAVDWDAHGLSYGIPENVHCWLSNGNVVIANGSRSVLPRFAQVFPRMLVVNVTARPEVLADRLEARGRESREDILQRLQRSPPEICGDYPVVTIDNSGLLEEAGRRFIETIETAMEA
ncbi:phosphonate metabolism protein/1,5-bisphosphokinase (PRPP-forming) PhnN [Allorhizobium ampelinum]|uniref:phosphonate metabolism protein/1,5-bisphosphokinase (PRPP-forming) PhnN n=1 Tax=Allorhizobium ampelinum TaxID=3025782 RepID=UPI001F3F0E40|nr:phosphonate metabolism protein/1,5-bisphosphokinase (PRPP-forming) PhnN [Allorhizobium ampelinum]